MSRKICVYCASSDRVDACFRQAARQMGHAIGKGGHTLVYGGGQIGLMGELACAVHEKQGRVVGVIPEFMVDKELAYREADELIVTENMRERKAIMEDMADAFIALPGGFGTLEELSEVIAFHLLHQHAKPIVIVNVAGYYDPLLKLFDHFIEQKFASRQHRQCYHVAADPDAAVSHILACPNDGG